MPQRRSRLRSLLRHVQANPVEANVTNGALRTGGSHDGVIAFGGGSALDTGKAIALMVGQSRPIWDFEDREDWYTRVNVAGIAPTIGIPTTSGTGSEVGRASVITDLRDTRRIVHPHAAALVIADPELTLGLPPKVTAAVGMDALSHNLEAYCAPFIIRWPTASPSKACDQAVAAGRRRGRQQHRSTRADDGRFGDGATAFQKGSARCTASATCSAISTCTRAGRNGVVMPYVLAWNRSALRRRWRGWRLTWACPSPRSTRC